MEKQYVKKTSAYSSLISFNLSQMFLIMFLRKTKKDTNETIADIIIYYYIKM